MLQNWHHSDTNLGMQCTVYVAVAITLVLVGTKENQLIKHSSIIVVIQRTSVSIGRIRSHSLIFCQVINVFIFNYILKATCSSIKTNVFDKITAMPNHCNVFNTE